MSQIDTWMENEYLPWKKAMAEYDNQQRHYAEIFQRNAAGLKKLASLLLSGELSAAMTLWNHLNLPPKISALEMDETGNGLLLTTGDGKQHSVAMSSLLSELGKLLKG